MKAEKMGCRRQELPPEPKSRLAKVLIVQYHAEIGGGIISVVVTHLHGFGQREDDNSMTFHGVQPFFRMAAGLIGTGADIADGAACGENQKRSRFAVEIRILRCGHGEPGFFI